MSAREITKKIILLFVAAAIAVGSAACGANSNEEKEDASETAAEEAVVNPNLVTEDEIASVGNYLENLNLPIWDGSVAESYAGGDGSESNPYQISCGAELALLAQDIKSKKNTNKNFVLTSDILLNDVTGWENWLESPPANLFAGIGVNSYPEKYLQGTFDGGGHTIYGMYSETGMFAFLIGATIENVNIDASVVNGASQREVGGLIGYAPTTYFVSTPLVVQNCSFNGIVCGGKYAGGLIGHLDMGKDITIKYCKSSGSVEGRYAGGVIGALSTTSSGTAVIVYCENYADVTSNDTAGGIVGSLSVSNVSGATARMTNCRNTGTLEGDDYAGGFAGCVSVGAGKRVSIGNCVNSGNGGVIDQWIIGSGGSLGLFDCYYIQGSPYNRSTSRPYSEDISESHLYKLKENEFRCFDLPLYSDAKEALDTGNYVKCGGKIYYVGYSNRIFKANYDGTQETEVARIASWDECYMDGNYFLYMDENYQNSLFNAETGEIKPLDVEFDTSPIALRDGCAYYGSAYSTSIIKYSIADGTTQHIGLDGIEGDSGIPTEHSYGFLVQWYEWENDVSGCNFYTYEGDLFQKITANDFGDDAYIEAVDDAIIVRAGDTINIYDPIVGGITETYTVSDASIDYCKAIGDGCIYAITTDGKLYRIDRE